MRIRALLLFCLGASFLGGGRVAFAGPLPADESLIEIMMGTQQSLFVAFLEAFGADNGNTVSFSSLTNFTTGAFSYTADAGSTYKGMLLNFSESGSSDALGNATYSGSVTLGEMAITVRGSNVVVGDPEYDYTDTITINGVEYKVVGKNKVIFGRPSTSTAILTSNGKNYNAVDILSVQGTAAIKYTWVIDSNPIPDKSSDASGSIDPTNGVGSFEARTTAVPEPSTVWMAITGTLALAGPWVRRRGLGL